MRFSWQFILKEILKNFQNICRNASEEDLDLSAISPAILEHLWFPDVEIRHLSSSSKDKQTNGKDNWTERQILFIYKPALFGHLFCNSLKLPTGSPPLPSLANSEKSTCCFLRHKIFSFKDVFQFKASICLAVLVKALLFRYFQVL